jgi:hypothetical protein
MSKSTTKKRSRGASHKNMRYNQWTEQAMIDALDERRQYGTGFGKLQAKYGISKTTIWKRWTGKVLGTGHRSGGKRQSKVLTHGKPIL